MPNRILREGILTSPRIVRLGWAEEVFYRRLMSVVDDFGRYYADLGLLHAACYPRQLNKVTDADIGKWLTSCVTAGLVSVYQSVDGESYLQLHDFGQQVRAKKSKFPDMHNTCVADAEQTQANEHLDVSVSVSVFEDDKTPRKRVAPPDGVSDAVWQDFLKIRRAKRAPMTETALTGIRREADKAKLTLQAALEVCCERGWQRFKAEWMEGKAAITATVPSRQGRDPELSRIEADRQRAAPMPEILKAQFAQVTQNLTKGLQ